MSLEDRKSDDEVIIRGNLQIRRISASPIVGREGEFRPILLEVIRDTTVLRLHDLLPPDWNIVEPISPWEKSSASLPQDKMIVMKEVEEFARKKSQRKFIEKDGYFLTLFHEMGHAHLHGDLPEETQRETYWLSQLKEMCGLHYMDEVEPGSLDRYVQLVLKKEKEAWVWALEKHEALKMEGIDLEPQMDIERIQEDIRKSLLTYLIVPYAEDVQVLDYDGNKLPHNLPNAPIGTMGFFL